MYSIQSLNTHSESWESWLGLSFRRQDSVLPHQVSSIHLTLFVSRPVSLRYDILCAKTIKTWTSGGIFRVLIPSNGGPIICFIHMYVEWLLYYCSRLLTWLHWMHCSPSWSESSHNVVTPVIDVIDPDTFNYKPSPLGAHLFIISVFNSSGATVTFNMFFFILKISN